MQVTVFDADGRHFVLREVAVMFIEEPVGEINLAAACRDGKLVYGAKPEKVVEVLRGVKGIELTEDGGRVSWSP